MKKILQFSVKLFFAVAVLQLTACQKFIDQYFPGHGHSTGETKCRITKVVQDAGFATRTGDFFYNQHGDPDSVIFDEGLGAARTYKFRYDGQHRLIEYISFYNSNEPENFYEDHHYQYNGDRIVIDTATIREAGVAVIVSTFDYDAAGRVIKQNRKWIEADGNPINEILDPYVFNYDAKGNLSLSANEQYDDKVNYLRTSKIWMFIEKNYSKNNSIMATGYNDNNLPLGFPASTPPGSFLQFNDPIAIEYDCE